MNIKLNIMKYAGIISDMPNGYTYKTAIVSTEKRARQLAVEFINRKNLDYCNISVITINTII